MGMMRDRLTSWKAGTISAGQPVMYLSTENNGLIALRLAPEMAWDLGRALLIGVLGPMRAARIRRLRRS
jgi:hypothetical protein